MQRCLLDNMVQHGEKGRRDDEFDAKQGVFHISWEHIAAACEVPEAIKVMQCMQCCCSKAVLVLNI
jgi:hypothetical protein